MFQRSPVGAGSFSVASVPASATALVSVCTQNACFTPPPSSNTWRTIVWFGPIVRAVPREESFATL